MIWFTSDQHFGHANIIKYCNRPFIDVEDMNASMMWRHNAIVAPTDTVFHLGDFSMHPRELSRLKDLRGRHHLVCGNHDRCHPVHKDWQKKLPLYFDAGFVSVQVDEQWVCGEHPFEIVRMHHLPYTGDHHDTEERYQQFRPKDEGNWLLHGHVHTTWKVKDKMINVGVDQWGFAPVSLDEIKTIIRGSK
jgi:calcineurin-like phosphoesterase family protein